MPPGPSVPESCPPCPASTTMRPIFQAQRTGKRALSVERRVRFMRCALSEWSRRPRLIRLVIIGGGAMVCTGPRNAARGSRDAMSWKMSSRSQSPRAPHSEKALHASRRSAGSSAGSSLSPDRVAYSPPRCRATRESLLAADYWSQPAPLTSVRPRPTGSRGRRCDLLWRLTAGASGAVNINDEPPRIRKRMPNTPSPDSHPAQCA